MAFDPIKNRGITSKKNFDPSKNKDESQLYVGNCPARSNDKNRIRNYWNDLLKQAGTRLKYWMHGHDISEHDFLYGEHTTARFKGPRFIRAFAEVEGQQIIFGPAGIETETDVAITIPIIEFVNVWGKGKIPLPGDLISIEDSACDRPEDQDPYVYQITEKFDSIEPIDPLGGHYVWKLHARRYDASYEENAPLEDSNGIDEDISDVEFHGPVNNDGTAVNKKEVEESVDKEAAERVNLTEESGVYGGYV